MTLSVSTAVFDGYPMETGLDVLAQIRVADVEPAFIKGYVAFEERDLEQPAAGRLSEQISDRGLNVQALSAHMDLSASGADDMLARRIDCAEALGSRILITNAGPQIRKPDILRTIDRAALRLESTGVFLALENPGHGAGDLIGSPDDAVAFIDMLDMAHVRLNVDVGNFATYAGGVEPTPALQKTVEHAVHIHLKDYTDVEGDWRFTALGQGAIDFGDIVPRLGTLPVGIELPLRLQRPRHGDPVRSAKLELTEIRKAIEQSLAVVRTYRPVSLGS